MIPRLFFRISFTLINHLIPLKRGKNIMIGCWNLLSVGQKLILWLKMLVTAAWSDDVTITWWQHLHSGYFNFVFGQCKEVAILSESNEGEETLLQKTSVYTPFKWCPSSSISLATRRKPLYSPQPPPTACLSHSLNTFAGSPKKHKQSLPA